MSRDERDLDDEVRTYLQMLIDEKVAAGADPADARRRALLEMEGVEQVKERVRDGRRWAWAEQAWQDARYSMRLCRRGMGARDWRLEDRSRFPSLPASPPPAPSPLDRQRPLRPAGLRDIRPSRRRDVGQRTGLMSGGGLSIGSGGRGKSGWGVDARSCAVAVQHAYRLYILKNLS